MRYNPPPHIFNRTRHARSSQMVVRLYNMDLHISVISDIKDVLERLFGTTVAVRDDCLSGHTWVMGRQQASMEVINPDTWYNLSTDMIRAFQERYDTFLSEFDGFICAHPNSFLLLFEKYNKPIIVVNSCRYDIPFSITGKKEMLPELNAGFRRCQEKGLLHMISNNRADNKYFLTALSDIRTQIIPSLCLYTGLRWNPAHTPRQKFLIYSGPGLRHPLLEHRTSLGRFAWPTLMEYRGIIHIPYEVSTMSLFEHISTEIPLFFPTKEFLLHLWTARLARYQSNYWRLLGKTAPPPELAASENLTYWIEAGDMYGLEGAYYFSSFEDLARQLVTFTDPLYEVRKRFVAQRQQKALTDWKTLMVEVFPTLSDNTELAPSGAD